MASVNFTTETQQETAMSGQGAECVNPDKYLAVVLDLFPRGAIWSRDLDTVFAKTVKAFCYELSRLEKRGEELLRELDPRTSYELLTDWERVLALPDTTAAATDRASRQKAAHEKYTSPGGQSPDFFIALADRLGYTIEIEHAANPASVCGAVVCGDAVCMGDWAAHQVVVHAHGGSNDAQLESAIKRFFHQHGEVIFQYDL